MRKIGCIILTAAMTLSVFVPAFDEFKKLCRENGWDKYTDDGIHLNADGNKVLADLWLDDAKNIM